MQVATVRDFCKPAIRYAELTYVLTAELDNRI